MKIPQEIFGENKVRDAMIIKMFSEGYMPAEIKEIRNLPLTIRRIEQILYNNRQFVKIDKEFEEIKQINRIKCRIRKSKNTKKDVYDWETLLDSKITPKKIEHSGKIDGQGTKIFIVKDSQKENVQRDNLSLNSETNI